MADRVLGPGAKGDPENPEMKADVASATKEELYEQAQELDVEGRSSMSKDELAEAVTDASTTTTRKGR